MRVSEEKLEKACKLRLEGKSVRDAAALAGISPTTLRKHERGWIDGRGEIHGGWAGDRARANLVRAASAVKASKTAAALLDRTERIRLQAELASLLIDKVREFVPVLKLRNAREAKYLAGEAREIVKAIAQGQGGAGDELPPGVKQVVTLEDVKAHYERTRDITPSYIEPAKDPNAVPDAPPEAVDKRSSRKRAPVDGAAEEAEESEEDEAEESDEDRDGFEGDERDEERDDEEDSKEDSEEDSE